MPTFKIMASWECCGEIDIEADSLEDAIAKVEDDDELYNLYEFLDGDDLGYIDGSFKINEEICFEIKDEQSPTI